MDLSVIIVNWNTRKLLEDCLTSIYKFTKNIGFEVIVVDNNSNDGSKKNVEIKFPKVKLIANKKNLGFAKANNIGIKQAKGKYILLLNSDTYMMENSLQKLFEFANRQENIGIVAPQLLNPDKTIQQSLGFFPNLPQIFFWMSFIDDLPLGYLLKPYHIDHDIFYKKDQMVDWVTGAAILVPKNVIQKAGALDDKIFMYGEDVEWCYRIKKAGLQIIYTPITKIVHIGRGSSDKDPTRAFIGEFQGLKYFYTKHKSNFSLQILKILLKMGTLTRILIFGFLGRKGTARAYVKTFKVA
jgi:hypothetical protein